MVISLAGRWLACAAVVLAMALSPARAQERPGRIDLRPKFETGQTIRYKLEMTNSSDPVNAGGAGGGRGTTTPRPGQKGAQAAEEIGKSRSRIEIGLMLRVQSVSPEREAKVDLVFESMKLSTTTDGETVEFDSTKTGGGAEQEMMSMVLRSLIGNAMTLTVDAAGNIKSISGGEAFAAIGQFAGGGAGGGTGSGGAANKLFGPLFSVKSGDGFAAIGESWENVDKVDNALLGDFKMTTRHTLRGVSGKDANVDVSGRIEPGSESGGGHGPAQVKDSRYGGKYVWDTGAGALKQMDTTMSVQIEHTAGSAKTVTRNESAVKITRVR